MSAPSRRDIGMAAERLRGHVVATPLIGGMLLPGRAVPPDLRLKPEVLQPSGSIYFRGAMHWLLRQLGSAKGVVLHGEDRPVLAAAAAAALHRLPALAFTVGEPDRAVWAMLGALDCEVSPRPSPDEARRAAEGVRASRGFRLMPGVDDPDYAAGLATVGLELAAELPAHAELVVISPAELAAPVALGLAAADADIRVQGVDQGACPSPEHLAEEVRRSLRLDVGPQGLAALHWALEHDPGVATCAVLSC